jgi:hypothetical protein
MNNKEKLYLAKQAGSGISELLAALGGGQSARLQTQYGIADPFHRNDMLAGGVAGGGVGGIAGALYGGLKEPDEDEDRLGNAAKWGLGGAALGGVGGAGLAGIDALGGKLDAQNHWDNQKESEKWRRDMDTHDGIRRLKQMGGMADAFAKGVAE